MRRDNTALMIEGLVAGLVGYAAIVLFFGVVNVLTGRSVFYTAALLGSALLGSGNAGAVEVAIQPVVTYNLLHLLTLLGLGLFGAFIVARTERYPALWVLALLGVIAVGATVVMALFFFAAPLFGGGWWQLVAATALAAGLMGWYLLGRHPRMRQEIGLIWQSNVHV